MMQPGDLVRVWYDPEERDDLEGVAVLVRPAQTTLDAGRPDGLQCWWVKFSEDETGVYPRWVNPKDKVSHAQDG